MKHILLFMMAIYWWGCHNASTAKEAEVMAIHDEAMDQMGQLEALATQLSAVKDKLPVTDENADKIVRINDEIIALREAGDGMLAWMQSYRQNTPLRQAKDNAAYWAEELIRVQAVRDSIMNAINRAQNIIKDPNL